jgi:hypothetical protein
MPRTIISLTQEDKEWLAQRARAEYVPVTELVRRAIRLYRRRSPEVGAPSFEELTERTAGIWEAGDGLAYQERLRAEWERE